MHLRKATCYECEKHLRYMESSPAKQMGVTMHMGERFCTGGKRARKFKRNDPKIYVPSWCPKRKLPSELRVYCFKSTEDWMQHERLCYDLGKEVSPEARRYAVLYNCTRPSHPWSLQGGAMRNRTQKPLEQPFTGIMWLRSTTGSAPHSSTRRSTATSCWPCLTRRPHEKTRWRTRIEQYRKALRYLQ